MRRVDSAWASFFRRVGWSHQYQRGLFVVHGEWPVLVKVAPVLAHGPLRRNERELRRAAEGRGWGDDLLVVGRHPLPAVRSYLRCDPPVGWLGERDGDGWDWDAGLWARCDDCGRLGLYHEMRSWELRPCGHMSSRLHEGDAVVPDVCRIWADALDAVNGTATAGASRYVNENEKERRGA